MATESEVVVPPDPIASGLRLQVSPDEIKELRQVLKGRPELANLANRLETAITDRNHLNFWKFIRAAQSAGKDGEIEVDDDASVSVSDDGGAYVMAWLWVYNHDAGIEVEEDEE